MALRRLAIVRVAGRTQEEIIQWFESLNLKGRSPRGLKKEFYWLKAVDQKLEALKSFSMRDIPDSFYAPIVRIYNDFTPEQRSKIESLLGKNDSKPTEVKTPYATYFKEDSRAYKKFQVAIKSLDQFLSTLKGFHKKAIRDLQVVFVGAKVIKSAASYNAENDLIRIRLDKMGNTKEEYGSLRYVVLHELGHRYMRLFGVSWDYEHPRWITTEYSSRPPGFSDEEKFAELFALTHWESKYPEYKVIMSEFMELMR